MLHCNETQSTSIISRTHTKHSHVHSNLRNTDLTITYIDTQIEFFNT
jgi:hypothetical protein